jgi:hypothetical protein
VLAAATAANNANVGVGGGQEAVLDGFQATVVVSVIASVVGVTVTAARLGRRALPEPEPVVEPVEAVEPEAA